MSALEHQPENPRAEPVAAAPGQPQADDARNDTDASSRVAVEPGAPSRSEPIFNIPAVIVFFIAVMAAIHLLRAFVLPAAWDDAVITAMAFIPARYTHPLAEQDLLGWLAGPVGYSLLHGGFVHLIFNCVWLAAFATPLAQRIGTMRFVLLWITSAVFSAFFQAFVTDFANIVLIGASGVVSATVGAACRFSLALSGTSAMRFARYAPRLGIFEALTYRPVVMFILMWALSNALVVYGAGVPTEGYNVAWQAHVGGFLFGYLTFGFFDTQRGR